MPENQTINSVSASTQDISILIFNALSTDLSLLKKSPTNYLEPLLMQRMATGALSWMKRPACSHLIHQHQIKGTSSTDCPLASM